MVTVTVLLLVLVHALCFRQNKQAAISCTLFSVVRAVLRDGNLIQLIGFDIAELLQTLGFVLLSGYDDNYHS